MAGWAVWLTHLLLYKDGFEIQKYVSIERKILENIDQYYEAYLYYNEDGMKD